MKPTPFEMIYGHGDQVILTTRRRKGK